MRKFLLLFALVIAFTVTADAQILRPVKWSFTSKKLSATEAEVILTAHIEKGWHIYDQGSKSSDGPIPTSFSFKPGTGYKLLGKPLSSQKAISAFDKTFNKKIAYFEGTISFVQKVAYQKGSPQVVGSLEFMVCSDRQCLPPENIEFTIPIK